MVILENEEWHNIPEFESYQVSNLGRVKCCNGKYKQAYNFKWKYKN